MTLFHRIANGVNRRVQFDLAAHGFRVLNEIAVGISAAQEKSAAQGAEPREQRAGGA